MLGEMMCLFNPKYRDSGIKVFSYDLCEIHEKHWEAVFAATKIKIFYVEKVY